MFDKSACYYHENHEAIGRCEKCGRIEEQNGFFDISFGLENCWTNKWVRDAELPNKEFLFLIEKI